MNDDMYFASCNDNSFHKLTLVGCVICKVQDDVGNALVVPGSQLIKGVVSKETVVFLRRWGSCKKRILVISTKLMMTTVQGF